jgi:hypothetical protein
MLVRFENFDPFLSYAGRIRTASAQFRPRARSFTFSAIEIRPYLSMRYGSTQSRDRFHSAVAGGTDSMAGRSITDLRRHRQRLIVPLPPVRFVWRTWRRIVRRNVAEGTISMKASGVTDA